MEVSHDSLLLAAERLSPAVVSDGERGRGEMGLGLLLVGLRLPKPHHSDTYGYDFKEIEAFKFSVQFQVGKTGVGLMVKFGTIIVLKYTS